MKRLIAAVMLTLMLSVPAQAQCYDTYVPGEILIVYDTEETDKWYFPELAAIEDPEALEAEMNAWAGWIETLEGVRYAEPNILQCLA